MISHVDVASPHSDTEPRAGLLTLSVIVAAVAVMAGAIDGPFLFDDVALIHGNDRIHDFSHWREWVGGTLWETNYDPAEEGAMRGFWRPIVLLSYAIDWAVGNGSPFPFHVTNLAIHAANAVLLFRVLQGWLNVRTAALLGALLFAVHPVQTESVAWIAGRTDSLCVLGLLVAVLGLRKWTEHRALGAILLVGGLIFAFGSKEAAVVFPVLAAVETWSQRRSSLSGHELRRLALRVWPFALLSIAFYLIHRTFVSATSVGYPLVFAMRTLLPLESLGRYVALLVWPDDLAFGRATIPVVDGLPSPHKGYAALGVATLLAVAIGVWRWRDRRPLASLAALGTMALLAPVITVVWLGYDLTASPRFLYVPMIGVALCAGAVLESSWGERAAGRIGFVALTVALGARSFLRSTDYSDARVFWARELASNERYVPAQQSEITRILREHRPEAALRLAQRWFSDPGLSGMGKATLIMNGVAASLALTRDVETETLGQIERFAMALAAMEPGDLNLPRLGVHLTVPANSPLMNRIHMDRRQYLLYAANAASRKGDDVGAIREIDMALDGCADCWTILPTSALILARAGQLDRAQEILDRAQRVGPPENAAPAQANVQDARSWRANEALDPLLREIGFFSVLGAFGRAYAIALPVLDRAGGDPAKISKLAELAMLAGDIGKSKALLLRIYPAPEAEAHFADLYGRAPWRDQPPPEDGPS